MMKCKVQQMNVSHVKHEIKIIFLYKHDPITIPASSRLWNRVRCWSHTGNLPQKSQNWGIKKNAWLWIIPYNTLINEFCIWKRQKLDSHIDDGNDYWRGNVLSSTDLIKLSFFHFVCNVFSMQFRFYQNQWVIIFLHFISVKLFKINIHLIF